MWFIRRGLRGVVSEESEKEFFSAKACAGIANSCNGLHGDVYGDHVDINTSGNVFTLNTKQILSIDFEMDVDIQKYSKSSIVKGVAGATLFGVAGAVIGSAPKERDRRFVTCLSVVQYVNSSGEPEYLLLQDTAPNSLQAAKFTDALRPLITPSDKQKINL